MSDFYRSGRYVVIRGFGHLIWWGGWPRTWRLRYVRRSRHGPFGELVLGPVGLAWYVDPAEERPDA